MQWLNYSKVNVELVPVVKFSRNGTPTRGGGTAFRTSG